MAMVVAFRISMALLVAWLVNSGSRCSISNFRASFLAVMVAVAVMARNWLVFGDCGVCCACGSSGYGARLADIVAVVVVVCTWTAWRRLVCLLDVDWGWLVVVSLVFLTIALWDDSYVFNDDFVDLNFDVNVNLDFDFCWLWLRLVDFCGLLRAFTLYLDLAHLAVATMIRIGIDLIGSDLLAWAKPPVTAAAVVEIIILDFKAIVTYDLLALSIL
jgi:hypothetical protein